MARLLIWKRKEIDVEQVLEKFLASSDFEAGVIASTKANRVGEWYSVELFPDGTWRTLWSVQIGNRYQTPGCILALPALDEDSNDDNWLHALFETEREDLAQKLRKDVAFARLS